MSIKESRMTRVHVPDVVRDPARDYARIARDRRANDDLPVQPFTAKLIVLWSVSGSIEMIITGAIVGAIYGSGTTRT